MTLDVLHFIHEKGDPDEIRESQRKRGLSEEIVDKVAEKYAEWVKRTHNRPIHHLISHRHHHSRLRSFEPSKVCKPGTERDRRKEKGQPTHASFIETPGSNTHQAKENADDLVAKKKEIDAQVEAKRKEARECEAKMRAIASTAGNIVGKAVPVSKTEVSHLLTFYPGSSPPRTVSQDDNQVLRTWHPDGPNGVFEKKSGILAHHEVLLRLDAMDLDRGDLPFISIPSPHSTVHAQAQKYLATVDTSSRMTGSTSTKPSSPTGSIFCAKEATRRSNLRSS